jgi:hypothetical protein
MVVAHAHYQEEQERFDAAVVSSSGFLTVAAG